MAGENKEQEVKLHDTNQEIHKGLGQERQETQEVTGKTTNLKSNRKQNTRA